MEKENITGNSFFTTLKLLILLSPVPFGCVGKIFSPLFFIVLLAVSFLGLRQPLEQSVFVYEKWLHHLFYGFIIFLAFQIIPLPVFILRIISPETVAVLSSLTDKLPIFHSISLVPYETIVYAGQFLVFGLFFLVMTNIKLEQHEIISLFNIIILSGVVQVIFGMLKYFRGNKYFFLFFYTYKESEMLQYRLTGTLGNSDHFAFYLEMILPLILSLFFFQLIFFQHTFKKIAYYSAAAVLLGTGIILTGSRAGVGVMILSIIGFVMFSFFLGISAAVRQKLKIIFILTLAGVMLIGLQETVLRLLKTNIGSENRFKARWPGTLAMIGDFPFSGTGFGTYRYAYYLYDREQGKHWTTHAHNDYLEVFSDGGIVGGVLFLALISVGILSFYRMWWRRRHPVVKVLGLGIIVSLFAVIFHSL
ncbi:MAG: O-antigen ligase family protein, partial [Acidobacteria bacterium]|nr:O-antigen ligase family protein [Acidobacteriota bacterium]